MDVRIVLYLLESEHGSPVQYWSFDDEVLIRVGRSIENQVVIANPYISRAHAYLLFDDLGWAINAISEQGIFVASERREHLRLEPDAVFRLGAHGPFLRFGSAADPGPEKETVEPDDPLVQLLKLDEEKLVREVREIAEGDFFRELRAKVRTLREARAADRPPLL